MCVSSQVLLRQQGHSTATLYATHEQHIDLPLHTDGNYVVEVRAHSEGGDGAVAQINITSNSRIHRLLLTSSLTFPEQRDVYGAQKSSWHFMMKPGITFSE